MNNTTKETIELVYLVILKGTFDLSKIGQILPTYAKERTPLIVAGATSQHVKAAECLRDNLPTKPGIVLSKTVGGFEPPITSYRVRNNFYSAMDLLTKMPMEAIVVSSPDFLEKVVQPKKLAEKLIEEIEDAAMFHWCPKSHSTGRVHLEPVEEVDPITMDNSLITITNRDRIRAFKLVLKSEIPFRALMAATGIRYNHAIRYNGAHAECADYKEAELMVKGGDQIEILP